MLYHYYIYGLYFESDIQLYESEKLLYNSPVNSDVTIKTSYHFLPETGSSNSNYSFSENRIWFSTDAGSFLIENGNSIYAAPKNDTSNNLLSAYLLGWCINFLMFQRGCLGIHCSALSHGNRAFLISGHSGAGKSTTAISLIKNGYKLLSDDIAFTSVKDGFMVYPGLPLQKMCRDIADSFCTGNNLVYIDELKDKFASIDTESFDPYPRKLSKFFKLEITDSDSVEYGVVSGFEKVSVLLNSLFMASLFRASEYPVYIKNECLKLAGEIEMIRIKRPSGKQTAVEICNIIRNYLEE
ncbi:MAG: hypothetical protein IKP88_03925 [Lachnospiraceae bacterium]|nr:hypothetical protein [Lachnospiraceae bacterium]